ncbi:MAG: hypothetical protein CVV04_01770 [Firmicutes bacterium HGW-Firmicutes-9]|jgi:hypothetical protein|nr:MAG: hypothetical protein CVV04_01770 [Firmicutes bacterium HGW-Firmicutes-9]
MKKAIPCLLVVLLLASCLSCTPAATSDTPLATPTATPTVTPQSDIELADTPETLETQIRQYKEEGDFERVYEAAIKLTQIDPTNTDAYLAAAGALLVLNEQNEQEMKRILAEGILNAPEGVKTIANWLAENQLEGAVELPFQPDYSDPSRVNVLGNSAGNITNTIRAAYWRGGLVATQDGWIYYSRFTGDYASLYKMRTDGSRRMKFEGVHGYCLNVAGDWIYFINPDDNDTPYRMRTDGSDVQQLSKFACSSISVYGDWVYSDGYGENGSYYRFRMDGSEQTPLTDFTITLNFCDGEYGYVIKKSMEDGGIVRIPISGGAQTRVRDEIPSSGYCITSEFIYTRDEKDPWVIVRTDLDGNNAIQVFRANDFITALNVYEDKLIVAYGVYSDFEGNTVSREIAIVDLASGEVIRSWEAHTDPLCVGEGFLFYTEQDEGMRWHCVNLDTGEELNME